MGGVAPTAELASSGRKSGATEAAAGGASKPPRSPVGADALIDFSCAVDELSSVLKMPLALDVPLADGLNVLLLPLALTVTDAPLMRLPYWSRTVTVTLSAVPPPNVQLTEQAVMLVALSTTVD